MRDFKRIFIVPYVLLNALGVLVLGCEYSIVSQNRAKPATGPLQTTLMNVLETLRTPATPLTAMISGPATSAAGSYGSSLAGSFNYSPGNPATLDYIAGSSPGWFDVGYFPIDSKLSSTWGALDEVSVDIRQVVGTVNATTDCGLGLAFGTASVGTPAAPNLSRNLRLNGRDWNTSSNSDHNPRDLIRIFFEGNPGITDQGIHIDNLINDFNLASGNSWNSANWSRGNGFDPMPTVAMVSAGDEVDYNMKLVFDHTLHQLKITIGPPSTSGSFVASHLGVPINTSTWSARTGAWDLVRPLNYVSPSGDGQAGLDLAQVGGAGYGLSDFEKEPLSIGFLTNLPTGASHFSHMKIVSHATGS